MGVVRTGSSGCTQKVIDRVREATGVTLKVPEAEQILAAYEGAGTPGNYTDKKLPFRLLGQLMQNYNFHWMGRYGPHGDFVELGMFGPGSEMLPPLVQNNDLHSFMLAAAGI
jgi:alkaline phosphatase